MAVVPDTLGAIKSEVKDWLEESTLPDSRYNAAINDAIATLWTRLTNASVSVFMGGPVTLSIAAGSEGVVLISVPDPTVAPIVTGATAGDPTVAIHTIDAAYSLVTESGSETLISPIARFTTGVPGQVAFVNSPAFASGAIGWNCYARTGATGNLVRQNEEPLDFAQVGGLGFTEPDTGFQNEPSLPSPPTQNTTGDDIAYIRHLEAQMPDMGYKAYHAADISSLLMQRAARSVAVASQYQNYYWDMVNQRQLELRPALGMDWSPRYFYVKRARRLRYDNAPLPFLVVDAAAYLRYAALSLLAITVREFETAAAWDVKAEKEALQLELSVVRNQTPKEQYISPFS